MKMKGILKKGLVIALITSMTMSAFTGCGKKKKEDSILNEAVKGSKDYVYKVEDIDLGDAKISGYPAGLEVAGDKVYLALTGNDSNGKIYKFNLDGSNVESFDIPMNAGENYYNFEFLPDGSSYAVLSVSSEDEEPQTLEGGESAPAEGASASSEEATAGDSKEEAKDAKDASKEEATADSSKDDAKKDSDDASKDASKDESKKATEAASDDASKETSDDASAEGSSVEEGEEHEEGMGFYEGGDAQEFLVKFDNQGNIVNKLDLSDKSGDNGYFNIRSIIGLSDGKLLVSSTAGIETYTDEEGFKPLLEVKASDNPYMDTYSLTKGANDQIYAQSYGENGMVVQKFNPENGELSEPCAGFNEENGYSMTLFGGNGYDIYVATENAFCGYDASKDELVKLMDYIDSDIETDYTIYSAVAISENEFMAIIPGFENDYRPVKLTKIPADQVKDKKIITLGGVYLDYDVKVKEAVVKFNQDNEEYKIKIVDYSKFNSEEDYEAGGKQFDMDIVSGNVPDIISLSTDQPIDKYRNKGVFMDIKPLFDKDEDLKNIEIHPNILKAMSTGDKMYTVIPGFMVGSMLTRARFAQGKNTLSYKDCEDLMKENNVTYDTAFGFANKESVMAQGIIYAGDKYIDTAAKTCSFDSEGFINLLKFANNFPEKLDYDKYQEYEGYFATNQALFEFTSLSGFNDYGRCKQATFADDIAFVGIPNDEGANESVIFPYGEYAISAQTKYPEVAWDFIKTFWSDDYQKNMTFSFPVTKSGFDDAKAKAMERPYMMVDGKKEYYDDSYYVDGKEIPIKPLTQEEVDEVSEFVLSIDKCYNYNNDIHNIIMEEAGAYFSGQKSAEEVAKIIQSRISIFINENG
ncbi:hypothetical protein D6853_03285 [Butyrivibrio sp. X503]|uniref:ABC transporter substrate-binding protein n=1 Tax=Butyrivibrio sp. X503 TaxID=2364878 RepID=UPI000EA83BCF|nr:hypothetical protein [Butyrivibrio sp. X503]RKM57054.1 hypothetical protein D6853_03285 [Butyrivibrio sp. X503]